MRNSKVAMVIGFLSLLALPASLAYPTSWMGPTGLFGVVTADTLDSGDFAISFYFNNYDRSLSDGNYSYDYTYLSLPLAVGIAHRFELSASPNYNMFRSSGWSQNGMGDTLINLKVNLLKEQSGPGIGLLLFGKIPTADEDKGLGTGEADYGVKLLLSKHMSTMGLHLNVGWTKIGDPDYVDLKDQVTYGLGINLPLNKPMQFIMELTGETATSDAMDDPLDLTIGARYLMDNGFLIGGGVRYNLVMDWDSCPVGGVFQIGYETPHFKPTPVPNRPPVITCKIESEEVIQGQYTRITASAYDPDGDPITYQWTTTGCKIVGSNDQVQFYAENCAPGTYTITVTVKDAKGLSATCSVNARVVPKKKEMRTEKLDLPVVPFKKGTRVDNAAKAILDDIAISLKKFPDAKITLVGHSDNAGKEKANVKLGMDRAENVKKYLVERHKINPDRFVVESRGSSQPVADNKTEKGRQKNRRVEVIMMVEKEVE